MLPLKPGRAIDYLVVGHVAVDLTPAGPALGGTAAYAGLTAAALGLRVGVLTSAAPEIDLAPLAALDLEIVPSTQSTTYENRYGPSGRAQFLHGRAAALEPRHVPPEWRTPRIAHLGPIAGEVDPALAGLFAGSLLGLTPQGWMRAWDGAGRVSPADWPFAPAGSARGAPARTGDDPAGLVAAAGAVVISTEDVGGDEHKIEALAEAARLLVVTDGPKGARVFWNRDQRRFPAPAVPEVDPTGSGDVFAAAFFVRLYQTRDPWESARFANVLAAASVGRSGIAGAPTQAEIEAAGLQVIP
jgi:sugar/nucleoside kinase (ribokinase family)